MASGRLLSHHLALLAAGAIAGFAVRMAARTVRHDADIAALRDAVDAAADEADRAARADAIIARAKQREPEPSQPDTRPSLRVLPGGPDAESPPELVAEDRRAGAAYLARFHRAVLSAATDRPPSLPAGYWKRLMRESPTYSALPDNVTLMPGLLDSRVQLRVKLRRQDRPKDD